MIIPTAKYFCLHTKSCEKEIKDKRIMDFAFMLSD